MHEKSLINKLLKHIREIRPSSVSAATRSGERGNIFSGVVTAVVSENAGKSARLRRLTSILSSANREALARKKTEQNRSQSVSGGSARQRGLSIGGAEDDVFQLSRRHPLHTPVRKTSTELQKDRKMLLSHLTRQWTYSQEEEEELAFGRRRKSRMEVAPFAKKNDSKRNDASVAERKEDNMVETGHEKAAGDTLMTTLEEEAGDDSFNVGVIVSASSPPTVDISLPTDEEATKESDVPRDHEAVTDQEPVIEKTDLERQVTPGHVKLKMLSEMKMQQDSFELEEVCRA